ncbi:hypothetical protein PoB_005732600 [Plakobranchus ocellatus]|uniref:Uncharacterized protein n=1 Tax=Plakobranchus ocellatus TaxID=259542 RepID=A0AAV4C673_9GAST|nr:hypothetical protein PoB_005732600 [Plakobranchus ocellatus]
MGLSRNIMRLQRRLPSWCVLSPSNLSFILVFALVYLTLRAYLNKFMRQRTVMYQLALPKTEETKGIARIFSRSETNQSSRDCLLLSLSETSRAKSGSPLFGLKESVVYGSCRRVPPVPGSCDVADEIFFSELPASCFHQDFFNFCQIEGSPNGPWKVACNETSAQVCLSNVSVGLMNQTTGTLDWVEVESLSKVSDMLNKLLNRPPLGFSHFGFSFIKCVIQNNLDSYGSLKEQTMADSYYNSNMYAYDLNSDVYGEQLLILPPHFKKTESLDKMNFRNSISINIVFIDSVSHQHFFRSLKDSVNVLEKLAGAANTVVSVFDFELVQAVRSRTFESLEAIFAGIVNTTAQPFGVQNVPPKPLTLEVMLASFKQRGYHTLWLEDLCHTWEWGLPKDLHFMYTQAGSDNLEFWAQMWRQLHRANLDDIGPTLAMCKVLQANGVPDHFHGPDAVCYNGRHQHEYLLDYLLLHQQAAQTAQRPTFTFTMSNVGHEDTGRRIQTLDSALASYLESASHLSNTLTILLSDHGNSYGAFLQKSQEAKRELFHPVMIFIVPKRVAHILGIEAMHALKINTRRLVSFLDLHKALLYTQKSKKKSSALMRSVEAGLFYPVNASRTCNDIPRIKPNLCICQDFETAVANNTHYNLLGYFALGQLNDEIQRQALLGLIDMKGKNAKESFKRIKGFNKCQRLKLEGVENIKRSEEKDGSFTIKMELFVQLSQVFLVSLIMKPQPEQNQEGLEGSRLQLQTFERLTAYSQFSACASADNVWQSLCVCDLSKHSENVSTNKKGPAKILSTTKLDQGLKKQPIIASFNINLDLKDFNVLAMKVMKNNTKHGGFQKKSSLDTDQLAIPQYQDYVNENVLQRFIVTANFLAVNSRDSGINKTKHGIGSDECVLLVWFRHPQGLVVSAANTCQILVSVSPTEVLHKGKEKSKVPAVLYTAPLASNKTRDFIMPGGMKLLAVIWDEDSGASSLSETIHLKLEVYLHLSLHLSA